MMDANPDDPQLFVAEYSARWVIAKVVAAAAATGQPLTDWEIGALSTNPFATREEEHQQVVALTNKTVQIIRWAVATDKHAGQPVVQFERKLTIPVEWELHYQSIWVADTRLPWLISGVIQAAFLGNPAVGERGYWRHPGGRLATPAEVEAISDRIGMEISAAGNDIRQAREEAARREQARVAAEHAERNRVASEALHTVAETQLHDRLRRPGEAIATADTVAALLDGFGWDQATAHLIEWVDDNLADQFWVDPVIAADHRRRPQLLWMRGGDWIAFTGEMSSWIVSWSVNDVNFAAVDIANPDHSPEKVVAAGFSVVVDALRNALDEWDDTDWDAVGLGYIAQAAQEVARRTGDDSLEYTAGRLLAAAADRYKLR